MKISCAAWDKNRMFDATHPDVRAAVERALAEDLGSGDVTTNLTVPEHLGAHGFFLAKQDFVAAGLELVPLIYQLGGGAEIKLLAGSGDSISKGMHLAEVRGPARVLLSCERVALNFLQRLSGVATLTHQHVQK